MLSTHSTFPTYETYRDSGVEWLGEIPTGWETKRIKFTAKINPSGDKSLKDEIVTFLPMEAVSSQGDYETSKINKRSSFSDSLTEFKKNDLILAKITPCFENGKSAYLNFLPTDKGVGSTEFHVLRPYTQLLNPKYLYYCLANSGYRNFAEPFMEGTAGQKRLTTLFLKNSIISFPDLHSQNRIVKFLDEKTAAIDTAIAKKQRLIELLKEQKAILINRAVTRGLNPDVPMKDSGVEWIGEIPAHWDVIPNRYLFKEQNERSKDGSETHLSMSQKLGLVPASEVDVLTLQSESYEGAKLVKQGDLVLNRLKAHLAVFSPAPCDGLVSPDYSVFRLNKQDASVVYFENLFKTKSYLTEFNKRVKGIVVGFYRLYSSDFNEIYSIVPPVNEQREIENYIVAINTKTMNLTEKSESQIQKLQEYKQTLIAHAVTGKIKVG